MIYDAVTKLLAIKDIKKEIFKDCLEVRNSFAKKYIGKIIVETMIELIILKPK